MNDERDCPVFAYQPPMELAALIERGNKAKLEAYSAIEECRQQRQELRYHIAYVKRGVRKLRGDQIVRVALPHLLGRTLTRVQFAAQGEAAAKGDAGP